MDTNPDITVWDLLSNLDPTKKNRCEAIDVLLAEKLDDVDTLGYTGYYLNYDGITETMVNTKKRINEIIQKCVQDPDQNISTYQLRNFDRWLNAETCSIIVKAWSENESKWDLSWISQYAIKTDDSEILIKVLEKLISNYNSKKSKYKVRDVESVFKAISKNNMDRCCKLLAESSPAVSACLLSRPDVGEEYIILGLKALSKLSKQRDVPVEIDFFALKTLGPRSRLDAMKQLLGLAQAYRRNKRESLPFKVIPTKEEMEEFLFPCCIKYNDEVSSIIQRYVELVNKTMKEVNNG